VVYIQTPREGQKGRTPRIFLSNATLVAYIAGAIFDALNLYSRGSMDEMTRASLACDITLGSLYASYQVCVFLTSGEPAIYHWPGISLLFMLLKAHFPSVYRSGAFTHDCGAAWYDSHSPCHQLPSDSAQLLESWHSYLKTDDGQTLGSSPSRSSLQPCLGHLRGSSSRLAWLSGGP
jgi:hypothetical protein